MMFQIPHRLTVFARWLLRNPQVSIVFILAFGLVLTACERKGAETAQEAALQSLKSVADAATPETYKRLGFESLEEVANLQLGVPFPVYFVALDAVKGFGNGQDAETLLAQSTKKLYPVESNGQVRTSMSIEKKGDRWETVSIGRPGLIRRLELVRRTLAAKHNRDLADYFVVSMPSIYLMCVGYREGGELKLVPLSRNDMLAVEMGQPWTGNDLFAHLSKRLVNYSGALPPRQ